MDLREAYSKLNLHQNATIEEVKAAYKTLAQKYNPDNYAAGPLYDDAQKNMQEINDAFDLIMTDLRTGEGSTEHKSSSFGGGSAQFASVRDKINKGNADAALAELNNIPNGPNNAEWNYLVGKAYYHKGWVNDALRYFTNATNLDPNNLEYRTALNNINNGQDGNMHGNPYQNQNVYGGGMGCSCCDMCAAFMCMDLCCSCGGC